MFDENQLVKILWNNTNQAWYTNKGYHFTKRNDEFYVYAHDLTPHSAVMIEVICDYCGEKYISAYSTVITGRKYNGKDACKHCAALKANEISMKKRAAKKIGAAEQICKEKGYNLLTTQEEYTSVKMQIEFVCPRHGKQSMLLDNFLRGHECRQCAYEKVGTSLKFDSATIKEIIDSTDGNCLLNPEDYINTVTSNLKIRCTCGNIYTTSFTNFRKKGVTRCETCSRKESSGEKQIREYLDLNGINYIQEMRFDECRRHKPLPFDFYLPQYNLIIEYDGVQHFDDIKFMDHVKTKESDEIKTEFCQNRNIDLLRIPYWEKDNIEKIIDSKLNL